ncbi:hypothetical protein GCM10009630_02310 [Kribbella jejuensis]|uniref:Ig-like domain-containing protein n=1 Tax=Kribbella jejuensis TaxID=236068 RepID=A0A542EUM5_9ACTN|nr:hypothetical protein [Kribbella jejuensis]TQJ19059.1 hypothetical protein FB475_3216 [Kribbella jejuensis]
MRTNRVLAAALLAIPLIAAPVAANASPDPDLHITSVTLNKTGVAVSGLNTVPVTVTVKGSYAPGPTQPVNVILERTGGSGQERWLFSTNLVRNESAGAWSGPLNVPSTANGTFKVTGVQTGPFFPGSGSMTDPTPYAGPSLAVTGTHQPKITASVNPKLVPYGKPYSIKWAVTDAQTGKPYGSRVRVVLGIDNVCAEYSGPSYTNLTATDGTVTKAYAATDANWVNCLLLPGNPASVGGLGLFVARPVTKPTVTAVPSRTSAPVGTVVPVNGGVYTVRPGCKVYLQRLYGATQWRNVSAAMVRSSGRYTVNAQPAYKGTILYRAWVPACSSIGAVSKAFSIRGT